MTKDIQDKVTKAVALYLKENGFNIHVISRETGISSRTLEKILHKGTRRLQINEFLMICSFLQKNPREFFVLSKNF